MQHKFRVWHKEFKKYLTDSKEWFINLEGILYFNDIVDSISGSCGLYGVDKNLYVIQQFTGIQDKNGCDIYAGDIVKFHWFGFDGSETDNNSQGVIIYDSKLCAFVINVENDNCFYIGDTTHFEESCIEIIGNIAENCDLLNNV